MDSHAKSAFLPFILKRSLYIAWNVVQFLIGPAFGIIAFVCANNGLEIKDKQSEIPLIWALIGYVLGRDFIGLIVNEITNSSLKDRLESLRITFTSKVDESVRLFQTDVHSRFRITHIEDAELDSHLDSSLKSAHTVKNTYIGLYNVTGRHTPRNDRILEHYTYLLGKSDEAIWIDICGLNDLFDGRFEALRERFNKTPMRGKHELHVFSTSAPIINFLLCGPRDEPLSDVYFGWIQDSANNVGVFHSKDQRLISLFDTYFERMKNTRSRITSLSLSHKGRADLLRNSSFHRLCGTWISVSGAVKQIKEKEGTVSNNDVRTYAIMTISYEDGWKVSGQTFSYDTRVLVGEFVSVLALVSDNSIYYRFATQNVYGRPEADGIGTYSIRKDADVLIGYYVRNTLKSSQLRAKKIDAEKVDDREYVERIVKDIVGLQLSGKGQVTP